MAQYRYNLVILKCINYYISIFIIMVTHKYKIVSEGHDGCIIFPGIVPLNKTSHLFVTKISNKIIIENEKKI